MNCRFTFDDHGDHLLATCSMCGRSVAVHSRNVVAPCRRPPPPGLGDMVASLLAAVGITKERVERIVGGPCGCQQRQQAWNAAGAKYLGLPSGTPVDRQG